MSSIPIEPQSSVAGVAAAGPVFAGTARGAASVRARYLLLALGAAALFGLVTVLRLRGAQAFDHPVTLALNSLARRSRLLDYALRMLDEYDLFQGMPLLALACGAFFAQVSPRRRVQLVAGCGAAAAAAACSRLLQLFLPHLPRPMFDPTLAFIPPYGADVDALRDWSSFPSDHAALLWGVVAATFLAHRRVGLIALLAATVSSLARLYGGLHYASDLLGGALLGWAGVLAVVALVEPWADRLAALAAARPAVAAAVLFLFAAQAATLFENVRSVGAEAVHHLRELRAPPPGAPQINKS